MALLSYSQLEELWIGAGGSKLLAPLMAAIALAESGELHGGVWYANSDALNPNDNGGTQTSVGPWQVSTGTHQYPADWTTPEGNARAAVAKLQTQGLTAWGTYTSGAYRRFLQGAAPPPGSALIGGQVPQSGGGGGILGDISSAVTAVLGVILPGSTQLGKLIAGLGPGGGIGALLAELIQVIDWTLHPSNWIRLFCGLAGAVLVLAGIWQLSHAGAA